MIVVAPALAPVTVTVWVVAQFSVVNTNAPDTVAVPVAALVGVTVTSPVGRVAKETVYVAVAPPMTPKVAAETATPRAVTVTATESAVTLLVP